MKDDAISRKAAIDVVSKGCQEWRGIFGRCEENLLALPSIRPERKTGRWFVLDECLNEGIYCSECHKKVFKIDYSNTMKWKNFKFCPNCGADMREKEEWIPIQDPWKGEEVTRREWDLFLAKETADIKEDIDKAINVDRWIPVSEGLPPSREDVIVSVCVGTGDTKYNYTSHGWLTTDKEYWIVENEINNYVVAWMPNPEPYKERR